MATELRIIPRIDVKGDHVIRSIYMEGVRKVGRPSEMIRRYYEEGADEILLIDAVASLYRREPRFDLVKNASRGVFVPLTLGGGIRSLSDIEMALKVGADKVAINTAAVARPELITEAARIFGSQCIVGSVVAKTVAGGKWHIRTDNARVGHDIEAIEWARRLCDLGAGELLITSVDRDGTKKGCDLALAKAIGSAVSVPLIVSGGVGGPQHIWDLRKVDGVCAVAVGSVLHYKDFAIQDLRKL